MVQLDNYVCMNHRVNYETLLNEFIFVIRNNTTVDIAIWFMFKIYIRI